MRRLEVSGAVQPLYWTLGVKGLMIFIQLRISTTAWFTDGLVAIDVVG